MTTETLAPDSTAPAPSIRVPHPGPRTREVLDRVRAVEGVAALTFGLSETPPVVARASGAVVEDPDGNLFLDMVAGFGSLNLGHCHPRVVEAASHQLALAHQAMSVGATVRTDLLERLAGLGPVPYRAILAVSGSEAVEIALKLARRATGKPGVLAFSGGFHGRTLGALALMGRESQRRGLGGLGVRVEHLPYPDPYRSPFAADPAAVSDATLELIDRQLSDPAGGWDDIGAVIVEPVQGNGGMIPAPAGFVSGLAEVCRRNDVLFVADEVMSGFHRTGQRFAFEHDGATPDIVVLGKSLSAGLPLSACLVSPSIDAAASPNTETSTYAGNLVSCAAALAALDVYEEEDLSARSARLGDRLVEALRDRVGGLPTVGEVRGRGLMVAVELVADRATREPLPIARRVTEEAIGRGVILYAGGHHGQSVCLLPPLVATESQLDAAVETIGEALAAVGVG